MKQCSEIYCYVRWSLGGGKKTNPTNVTNGELAADCGLVSVDDVIYMDTNTSCTRALVSSPRTQLGDSCLMAEDNLGGLGGFSLVYVSWWWYMVTLRDIFWG